MRSQPQGKLSRDEEKVVALSIPFCLSTRWGGKKTTTLFHKDSYFDHFFFGFMAEAVISLENNRYADMH